MGYIFEELIRRFNESRNEEAGDHFTPREVIRLMVNLIFAPDSNILTSQGIVKTLYAPAADTCYKVNKKVFLEHDLGGLVTLAIPAIFCEQEYGGLRIIFRYTAHHLTVIKTNVNNKDISQLPIMQKLK